MRKNFFYIMIGAVAVIALAITALIPVSVKVDAANKTYYVDSVNGNDKNSGTSSSKAWKSLAKVNKTTFSAGDKILFKAGGYYSGSLHPLGSGQNGNPIVIDMYGTGSKPVIDGSGNVNAVFLSGQSFIEINNLEITNNGSKEGTRRGIYVQASAEVKHVYVKNCYVHNVCGNNDFSTGKPTGGIVFMGTWGENSKFTDVLIEGNTVNYCDRTGIYFGDGCGDGVNPVSSGLVMRNNSINYPGGDGAIINCTTGGLIEYNVVNTTDYVSTQVSAGIWPWYCKDTVFQYNEGYGCKYSADYDDGMPWDVDGGNNGVIYQYNYSHDNDGGCAMICADSSCPSKNSIIRYNISQNDGGRVLTLTGPSSNTYFYNNTVYVKKGMNTDMIGACDLEGNHKNLYCYNNIFYNLGNGGFDMGKTTGNNFDYNVFYGNHPKNEPADAHKLTSDPKFVAPGTAGIGRTSVTGYNLKEGSPCVDSGKNISGNGGKDYWGNEVVSGKVDRGACEFISSATVEDENGNLAYRKSATSSTNESDEFPAANAFDGDNYTRWASAEGVNATEWICVDLGKQKDISKVSINWEAAYAKGYKVQVSKDGETFTTVATVTDGDGGLDKVTFNSVNTRYVRIYCTEKYDADWGYSIYEIEIGR